MKLAVILVSSLVITDSQSLPIQQDSSSLESSTRSSMQNSTPILDKRKVSIENSHDSTQVNIMPRGFPMAQFMIGGVTSAVVSTAIYTQDAKRKENRKNKKKKESEEKEAKEKEAKEKGKE
ncbi:hypothetical protein MT418_002241 [Batrachochytrium dendrobatidis]